ncbi:BLUF domain-containing protein [Psychrobacter aestuarii]|uniref:BLUF domain-containing protein n=1 Tax=Psychrobacter aestuarii TaxID=556327 RepID=A0ABN0VLU6_9GAMM|nr:BLUF domain-containing protein [Psychrobacter aestuarii]
MSTHSDTMPHTVTDLYQLVYISHITSIGLSGASTLNDIAEASVNANKANNITGILCYGNGCFFQCVEGTEQALTDLKNKLLMDERHKDFKILDFSHIEKRRFKSWSLRSIVLERWLFKDDRVKKLMPFKPYEWSEYESEKFLSLLQEYYEKQENDTVNDTQPIKYNALGLTLNKVVGEHQAFLLIQAVLGALVVIAVLWFLLSTTM